MTDDPRLDDAVAEWLDLRASGRTPLLEDFVQRWPDLAAELRSVLGTMADMDALEEPVPAADVIRFHDVDYEVEALLGHGGMGEVHLAIDRRTDDRVAIKVLAAQYARDPERRARFEREMLLGMRLRHPGIVAVRGRTEWDGLPCLVLDYVHGIDLGAVISELRKHPPKNLHECDLATEVRCGIEARGAAAATAPSAPPASPLELGYYGTVARIVAELADALQHAHDNGIVHRDVKPQNVLLDASLHPRLLDFGLAIGRDDMQLSRSSDQIGTLPYMSPEMVAHGRARVDHRTDVYSLGVSLYELLTLSLPFSGPSSPAVIRSIERDPTPWPRRRNPDVPADLQGIVLRALAKKPEQRYASASALAADLRRFLRFERVSAPTPGPIKQVSSWIARHPRFTGATLAVAAIATIAPIVSAHERNRLFREHVAEGARCEAEGDASGALLAYGRAVDIRAEPEVLRRFMHLSGARSLRLVGLDPADGVEIAQEGYAWSRLAADKFANGIMLRVGAYLVRIDDAKAGIRQLYVTLADDTEVLVPPARPEAETEAGMARYSGGTFAIGKEGDRRLFSTPREVSVEPFLLDRREVSNREYADFVAATGHRRPTHDLDGWPAAGTLDDPVTGVDWDDAQSYAEWAGKRLPTSVEWEIACRGAESRAYAYGAAHRPYVARLEPPIFLTTDGTAHDHLIERKGPWPVHRSSDGDGPGDVTPEGVMNLTGNVREWVQDAWQLDDSRPRPTFPVLQRTVRGGSFISADNPDETHAARRHCFSADTRSPDIGFRCAKSIRSR